jgi:protein-tyrosine phosphatase
MKRLGFGILAGTVNLPILGRKRALNRIRIGFQSAQETINLAALRLPNKPGGKSSAKPSSCMVSQGQIPMESSRPSGPVQRLRSLLGILRRELRRFIAGSLHPWRRRRALERLRHWPVPGKVLVLCHGNICRSPYVEAYLKDQGDDLGIEVSSAGFIGPGRPPPSEALKAASRRQLHHGDHISRLVSEELLDDVDLILLVDASHRTRMRRRLNRVPGPHLVLGDLDPEPVKSRTIPDPWGESQEVYDQVFERLDRCLEVLLDEWRRRGSG